jgi:hypothetical protein
MHSHIPCCQTAARSAQCSFELTIPSGLPNDKYFPYDTFEAKVGRTTRASRSLIDRQ